MYSCKDRHRKSKLLRLHLHTPRLPWCRMRHCQFAGEVCRALALPMALSMRRNCHTNRIGSWGLNSNLGLYHSSRHVSN